MNEWASNRVLSKEWPMRNCWSTLNVDLVSEAEIRQTCC